MTTEQASVDALYGWAGRDPELVVEQEAQAVVDTQRLCDVPALRERLHQDHVAGLAKRGQLDQLTRTIRGLRQSRPAEPEPCLCEALEPAQPNVVEASPPFVQPGLVVTLEQRPAGDVIGDPGGAPRFRPLAGSDVRLGTVQPIERGLDIDECAGRQHELELGSTG